MCANWLLLPLTVGVSVGEPAPIRNRPGPFPVGSFLRELWQKCPEQVLITHHSSLVCHSGYARYEAIFARTKTRRILGRTVPPGLPRSDHLCSRIPTNYGLVLCRFLHPGVCTTNKYRLPINESAPHRLVERPAQTCHFLPFLLFFKDKSLSSSASPQRNSSESCLNCYSRRLLTRSCSLERIGPPRAGWKSQRRLGTLNWERRRKGE